MRLVNLISLRDGMGFHGGGDMPPPLFSFRILPPIPIPILVADLHSPFLVEIRIPTDIRGFLEVKLKKKKIKKKETSKN